MLELEHLSIGFKKRVILEDLSLTLKPGELAALAGPNGGGKTTLLKTIGGLLPPLGGRVLLNGNDLGRMSRRERAERIGILFQSASSDWPFTVEELVAQGRFPHRRIFGPESPADRRATAQAIEAAGLGGYEQRPVTELSGGEFQRTLIARAMAQEADLLLLDEPANNLDPKYQYMAMNLVRAITKSGRTALVSMHDLNLASLYADRIILIHGGKVAAFGSPAEVLQEPLLDQVFDIPLKISPHPGDSRFKAVSFPVSSLR
ncbi:MAG: ABC transporter ATP-binding protein [Spirochaetaceae bacterium]|jgi:iron complex transport system ATP-binding protein|nr:ABC transporter ATP-binding protein [Spirochaetaceae bacterium]